MENKLGTLLKERRKEKKLFLTQLTAVSGVSTAHIARIERGERFPSVHTLRKLAGPLGFSETQLFKLAGLLARDASDDRIERLKYEINREIADFLVRMQKKLDSL